MSKELEAAWNDKQREFDLCKSKKNVLIWGRATGKSEGPVANFSLYNVQTMPRSVGFLGGVSYESLLTKIIPGIKKGWAKFGYEEDIHYFIRKFPPRKWNWPKAYRQPERPDYFISWYNGSGQLLLSLDRSMNNGTSTDYGIFDEARFFKKDKIDEIVLTIRDNMDKFGHLWNHRSLLFTTDMPRTSEGRWLFDFEKEMDPDRLKLIYQVALHLQQMFQAYIKSESVSYKKKLAAQIEKYEEYLNDLKRDATYYSEASTLENVAFIGIDTIKDFISTLSPMAVKTSVFNKRLAKVENGFYALLSEDKHGYYASNHSYIDSLDFDFSSEVQKDCRWDADLVAGQPLHVGADYNNAINCICVGQTHAGKFNLLNALYVKHPQTLKDVVAKFARYYLYHGKKEVVYYYDHTAIARDASSDISYADEFMQELKKHGWIVRAEYIGKTATYLTRHRLAELLFTFDKRVDRFGYNRNNCEDWEIAMQSAETKQTTNGFEKSKASEKDPNTPPEHATHITDAFDTLMVGTQYGKVSSLF